MAENAKNFFERWSQRKQDLRQGTSTSEVPKNSIFNQNLEQNTAESAVDIAQVAPENIAISEKSETASPTPPTMQEAQALTKDSDFKPFIAKNVAPEVKNAAMKKLFADPHFNVMDMMDVYVDDYSKPDPIPAEMLRQLAASKFLKLFELEEEEQDKNREDADTPILPPVAQSLPRDLEHDHTDLRLQPNDAPGREDAVPGAG